MGYFPHEIVLWMAKIDIIADTDSDFVGPVGLQTALEVVKSPRQPHPVRLPSSRRPLARLLLFARSLESRTNTTSVSLFAKPDRPRFLAAILVPENQGEGLHGEEHEDQDRVE
ncbi:hypothetical protein BHM03_00040413 [Ensete ventricosum]|uniref:Uncharacterized protein n=1 Tax=Ensete ventricosum TaxID=4639 RepID=A0A445MK38_ENSVE|nr:hypothetical protein BHM03_00040413 [Ensete ventricosum]